jgi:hypothetical protein
MTSAVSATLTMPADHPARARREPNPPPIPKGAPRWQDALFEKTTLFFALFVLVLLAT